MDKLVEIIVFKGVETEEPLLEFFSSCLRPLGDNDFHCWCGRVHTVD